MLWKILPLPLLQERINSTQVPQCTSQPKHWYTQCTVHPGTFPDVSHGIYYSHSNFLITCSRRKFLVQRSFDCIGKKSKMSPMSITWHFSCFIQFSWIMMSDFDSCNPSYIINNCACARIKWASMTIFASNQKIAKYCLNIEKNQKNILPLPFYFHTWILEYISLTSNYPSSSFSDSMTILIWNCLFSDTCWQPDLSP